MMSELANGYQILQFLSAIEDCEAKVIQTVKQKWDRLWSKSEADCEAEGEAKVKQTVKQKWSRLWSKNETDCEAKMN